MVEHGIVGRGWALPTDDDRPTAMVDRAGGIAMVGGADKIATSIQMILATAPGERVMRPEFGCRIWELMFAPLTATTRGAMRHAVREALGRWEPRIEVEDIAVRADPVDPARVDIHVAYRIRSSNDRRNLVYPFYVIPDEEPR